MKKGLLFSIAMLLVIGIAGVSYASVDSLYEAAVIDVSGDVKVDPNADGGWFTPWVGMKLKEGALLKTGAGSTAQIVFDAQGLNILQIKENSRIAVNRSMVELPEGSVLADFGNLTGGSTFAVKTPVAVCAIRGSGMGVDHIQGMTVVMAYEDKVYVQGVDANGNPVGKEVVIPESWKAAVTSGGRIEPPTELSANEQAIWDAFLAATEAGAGLAPEPAQVTGDSDSKDLDEVKAEESEPSVSPSS